MEIGPVLDVSVITSFIQTPPTSEENTKVWVVISRSSNRYVDESRHRESVNLLEEVAQECMRDLDEIIPNVKGQKTAFLFLGRVWDDLTANEFSHGYKWETQVLIFVSKLVRHENSRERDGQMEQFLEILESRAHHQIPT